MAHLPPITKGYGAAQHRTYAIQSRVYTWGGGLDGFQTELFEEYWGGTVLFGLAAIRTAKLPNCVPVIGKQRGDLSRGRICIPRALVKSQFDGEMDLLQVKGISGQAKGERW